MRWKEGENKGQRKIFFPFLLFLFSLSLNVYNCVCPYALATEVLIGTRFLLHKNYIRKDRRKEKDKVGRQHGTAQSSCVTT
jgi:hypothetical protein